MSGNPAAVCYLEDWLPEDLMRKIAEQFGYSETAFVIPEEARFLLRWFTPRQEVELCGHATMAAAHAIFLSYLELDSVVFESRSGPLSVIKKGNLLAMDFPIRRLRTFDGDTVELSRCLQSDVVEAVIAGPTILAVVENDAAVREVRPDLERIARLPFSALIPTAQGSDVDFVSRFFGPRIGIPEDPVTGAAHTGLAPFWSQRLQKKRLSAKQLSARGGSLVCEVAKDRVVLSGRAEQFATGEIQLDI